MKYIITILSAWTLSLGSEVLDVLERNEAKDDQLLAESLGLLKEEVNEGFAYGISSGYQRLFINANEFDLDIDGAYLELGARYYVKPHVFIASEFTISFLASESSVELASGVDTTGSVERYNDLGVSIGFLDPVNSQTSLSLGLAYLFYDVEVDGTNLGGSESQLAVTIEANFLFTNYLSLDLSYLHALEEAQTVKLGLTYSF